MKVVKQSVEILDHKNVDPQKYIEKIARVCYKSENLITEDSNKRMIKMLYDNAHLAMLEHFIFTYSIPVEYYKTLLDSIDMKDLKYIRLSMIEKKSESLCIISFSARAIIELYRKTLFKCRDILMHIMEQVVFDHDCKELFGSFVLPISHYNIEELDVDHLMYDDYYEYNKLYSHLWISAKFICDRGVSHELVRHRDASFAQESSRYCCYNKDKFGNEITVVSPIQFIADKSKNDNSEKYNIWKKSMEDSEQAYFDLLNSGVTAENARSVLPTSLKTEIVVTAFYDEWKHIIDLRCEKGAHPDMINIMTIFKNNMRIHDNLFDKFLKR